MLKLILYPKGEEEDTHLKISLENRNEFQMKAKFQVEMLQFNYTGVTNEDVLKEKSRELLYLAEMYQLDVLKNVCEDKLC